MANILTSNSPQPFEGCTVYGPILHKKEKRNQVVIRDNITKKISGMSYARYLMSVHLARKLDPILEQVDHINDNSLDDRIENFQLLTRTQNLLKNLKAANLVQLTCPICFTDFKRKSGATHLVPSRSNKTFTCCSRECGTKAKGRKDLFN